MATSYGGEKIYAGDSRPKTHQEVTHEPGDEQTEYNQYLGHERRDEAVLAVAMDREYAAGDSSVRAATKEDE